MITVCLKNGFVFPRECIPTYDPDDLCTTQHIISDVLLFYLSNE